MRSGNVVRRKSLLSSNNTTKKQADVMNKEAVELLLTGEWSRWTRKEQVSSKIRKGRGILTQHGSTH